MTHDRKRRHFRDVMFAHGKYASSAQLLSQLILVIMISDYEDKECILVDCYYVCYLGVCAKRVYVCVLLVLC